jgi:pimeloyl-ACP methyl ester carboxylesterase
MTEVLGYPRYGVQGGDWGALIGTRMAHRHGPSLIGLHLNMAVAAPPPGTQVAAQTQARMQKETGYLPLQNTKPDTVAMGLTDSPLGLAAWILEKFRAWSDCHGTIESVISRDTLITNLMYYWLPNSAGSAARIYYESANMVPPLLQTGRIDVPTGIAAFPKEPYSAPRSWLEPAYSIVHWTDMPCGGHFPALEQPELLIADIRTFFAHLLP